MPRSFHGSAAGSFSAKTRISSPSTQIPVADGAHVAVVRAVDGVVLEEMRERLGVGEVVDRDEVEVRDALLFRRPHHLPPDPAEAVDTNPNCHSRSSSRKRPVTRGAARPKVT